MFSIAFMVVVFVLGNPETQTVFPFLPETLPRVAQKVWNRCCVSRRPPVCCRLSQSKLNHYQWHCLGFCSGDATPFAE
jgi:hypothetical protein